MGVKSISFSGIGPRQSMQDVGVVGKLNRSCGWTIVCDGMGGTPGGEVASRICVDVFNQHLRYSNTHLMVDNTADFLRLCLLKVYDAFHHHVLSNPEHEFMGTTLALAYWKETHLTFCWCGDSRFYLFRDGKLHFTSMPHNPSFDMCRQGKISLSAAEKMKTHLLTNCISIQEVFTVPEFHTLEIKPGDRLLTCTDGVWNSLNKKHLNEMANSLDLRKMARSLHLYLKAHATDNFLGSIVSFF